MHAMMECTSTPLFSPARNLWSIFPGGMREQQGRLSSDNGQKNQPEIKSEVSTDHHQYNDQQNVLTPPSSDPAVSPAHDDSSCSSSPPPHNHQDQDSLSMVSMLEHSGDSPETKKEKLKQCKQCSIIFTNKDEYFEHLLVHIKPGKALRCGQCKFVTEYKHHLEYHLRKHTGDKPYKCELCQYACTNKSMLTSHMKSHSSLYAYNCGNCPYKAKYQHTFKEHLRKNGHKPGIILNEDGTINHTAVIDLESRRRGPRTRQRQLGAMAPPSQNPTVIQSPVAVPQIPPLINPALIPMFYQPNIQDILMHMLLRTQASAMGCRQSNNDPASNSAADSHEQDNPDEVLDLSSRSTENRSPSIVSTTPPRRDSTVSENYSDPQSEESVGEEIRSEPKVEFNNNNEHQVKECEYCGITFRNSLMHFLHMSFHSKQDPLTCSKCGITLPNNVLFFDHVQTFAH